MAIINPLGSSSLNQNLVKLATERIASGKRINRASDDAAGLAVAEKFSAQARGIYQAERNANDVISFTQTAEGHLGQMQQATQRIRQLSVQAANGIYTREDREMMQQEVSQLTNEINRIGNQAEFNTKKIFTGDFARSKTPMRAQIGPNANQSETVAVEETNARTLNLSNIDITTPEGANRAIGATDKAIARISQRRSTLGAFENRLGNAIRGLSNSYQNTIATESRVRDADIAEQMMNLTKNEILTKTGIAMQAHRNMQAKSVLRLLQ